MVPSLDLCQKEPKQPVFALPLGDCPRGERSFVRVHPTGMDGDGDYRRVVSGFEEENVLEVPMENLLCSRKIQ